MSKPYGRLDARAARLRPDPKAVDVLPIVDLPVGRVAALLDGVAEVDRKLSDVNERVLVCDLHRKRRATVLRWSPSIEITRTATRKQAAARLCGAEQTRQQHVRATRSPA